MKAFVILISFFALVNSCNKNEKIYTIKVNSTKGACEGAVPMQCLQIQSGDLDQTGAWENLYNPIEGFDYQAGYFYLLRVKVETLDAKYLPVDASTKKYTLLEVLEKKADPAMRLHDIWALKEINGKALTPEQLEGRNKRPMLEIFIAEKRFGGNDGCNNLFGTIINVDESIIRFGMMGGTKMACPDMNLSSEYTQALQATTAYSIKNLELIFYDAQRNELLRFQKVD